MLMDERTMFECHLGKRDGLETVSTTMGGVCYNSLSEIHVHQSLVLCQEILQYSIFLGCGV